jgi:hypothetical protein
MPNVLAVPNLPYFKYAVCSSLQRFFPPHSACLTDTLPLHITEQSFSTISYEENMSKLLRKFTAKTGSDDTVTQVAYMIGYELKMNTLAGPAKKRFEQE